ncbi:MAG: hypothetical protein KC545_03410, partial [Nitrospira sp.]|nr:hypothetical protein [Nitrospira sp.]
MSDVLLSSANDKIIAVTSSGQFDIRLSANEIIQNTKAHGLTALAITSRRLLGFSSTLQHWGEQPLDVNEQVIQAKVLRNFCLVTTRQHLYG